MAHVEGQNLINRFDIMASNVNSQNERRDRAWCEEEKIVASAKMDEMLIEAMAALEQVRTLHETTPNPETKRQAKRILDSLHASLIQLAPLGVHSQGRLKRIC
ncbi:MAG TPA: hypothetical protein VG938_06380 [Verrucomicrobiae bacterium]|nr:hypothetical protein [Verrucomicrobiae bacterium]